MDRTHILAASVLTETPQDRPATRAEIDAFYDTHSHELFARIFRVRRWLDARRAAAKPAAPRAGFAPLAPTR